MQRDAIRVPRKLYQAADFLGERLLTLAVNSREKGGRGEREAAKLFQQHGFSARRGLQNKRTPDSPDVEVTELPAVEVEVKYRQAAEPVCRAFWFLAKETPPGYVPVLVLGRLQRPLVVLSADTFLDAVSATKAFTVALPAPLALEEMRNSYLCKVGFWTPSRSPFAGWVDRPDVLCLARSNHLAWCAVMRAEIALAVLDEALALEDLLGGVLFPAEE